MKEKYIRIIAAVILIAMGVIVAVCGAGTALDLYFGIGCLVTGAVLVILNVVGLARNKQVTFAQLFTSTCFIVIGISLLFTHYISFGMLVNLFVLLVLGLGVALMLYGIFTIVLAKKIPYGVVQLVLGALLVTLTIVYLNVAEFQKVFWIIVGIVIAVYGVLELILALTTKKKK